MSRAEVIVDAALAHGNKRSAVYRQGAVDVLLLKLEGRHILVPYRAGTVEFDAYFSGNNRGWAIWRHLNEGETEAKKPCFCMSRHEPKNDPIKSAQSAH